jgi:hypothetical protein
MTLKQKIKIFIFFSNNRGFHNDRHRHFEGTCCFDLQSRNIGEVRNECRVLVGKPEKPTSEI